LDRQRFLMMLKRMSILSSENYKGVLFHLDPGLLTVSSANPDLGDSKEYMEIDYNGTAMEIAFNPRYFIEALQVMEDDHVLLRIINEERPCIVEAENDKLFLTVIMPMKI